KRIEGRSRSGCAFSRSYCSVTWRRTPTASCGESIIGFRASRVRRPAGAASAQTNGVAGDDAWLQLHKLSADDAAAILARDDLCRLTPNRPSAAVHRGKLARQALDQ